MIRHNNFYQILKIPLFRNFIMAEGVASLGSFLAQMGFLFLAYELTESPVQTTGVVIAQVAPYVLFGLLGGAVSDSINKVKLMVAMDVMRAGLQALCLVLYMWGELTYTILLIIAFSLQTAGAFFNPASRGIIPQLVDKTQLVTANALMSITQNLCTILGPVLATFIITYGSMEMFFTVDMISYVLSAVLLLRLRYVFVPTNRPPTVKKSFSNFIIFFKQNKTVQFLLLITFIAVFTQKWAWSMGLLFKQGISETSGKQDYATLMLIFSIMSVSLGLILGSSHIKLGFKSYALGILLWSMGLFIFATAPQFYGDIFGVIVIATGLLFTSQSRVYLLQNILPKNILSQGFSLAAMTLYIADFISLALFGVLYTVFSLQHIFFGTSILMAGLAVSIFVFRNRFS